MSEPDHGHAIEVVEKNALPGPPTLHPLVAAAMAKDVDVEKLRQLLAMQTEWEAREAKKAYTRDLAELKRDLPPVIARDTTVDFVSERTGKRTFYKHASLANAMEQVNEPLARHGFAISWRPATLDGKVQVTCRLAHQGGHHEEVTLVAPPDTSGNKSAPQSIASTITLLERYSALALLGLATADMKEPTGDGAEPAEPSTVIDSGRNLAAAGWLNRKGIPLGEAVALVGGRPVPEWTAADLEAIKARWGQRAAPPPVVPDAAPAEPVQAAPGDGSPACVHRAADGRDTMPAPARAPSDSVDATLEALERAPAYGMADERAEPTDEELAGSEGMEDLFDHDRGGER